MWSQNHSQHIILRRLYQLIIVDTQNKNLSSLQQRDKISNILSNGKNKDHRVKELQTLAGLQDTELWFPWF